MTLREIDALIAEKVMGLRPEGKYFSFYVPRPYSSDIAAAWEVGEKLGLTVGRDYSYSIPIWRPRRNAPSVWLP